MYTYCNVGTIPLTPWVAAGVVAGVAGGEAATGATGMGGCCCCCCCCGCGLPTTTSLVEGGVISTAPPGKESEPGAINFFASTALEGCV